MPRFLVCPRAACFILLGVLPSAVLAAGWPACCSARHRWGGPHAAAAGQGQDRRRPRQEGGPPVHGQEIPGSRRHADRGPEAAGRARSRRRNQATDDFPAQSIAKAHEKLSAEGITLPPLEACRPPAVAEAAAREPARSASPSKSRRSWSASAAAATSKSRAANSAWPATPN